MAKSLRPRPYLTRDVLLRSVSEDDEHIWGSGTVEWNLQSENFIRTGKIERTSIERAFTGTISITANEGLAAADMKLEL